MRRIKIAGLAFLAVLALGVITAEAASAASTVLPEFSNSVAGNATSGASSLNLEGTTISCTAGTTATSPTSKKLGTFKILFGGCKAGGEPCRSLGQALASGTIEVTGEYHLVSRASDRTFYEIWFLLASTDGTGALHLECEASTVGLVLVWGNVLGQINAEPSSSERTFKINLKTEGGGKTIKQELNTYGNNSGTEITAEGLKGKLGTGTERKGGESAEANLLFTVSATSLEES
jgi:hypothetical protein